jgi:hypothetical protein
LVETQTHGRISAADFVKGRPQVVGPADRVRCGVTARA